MKVRIDAGGREVEIECSGDNVSVRDVAAEALAMWHSTDGATEPSPGPAFGLAAQLAHDRPPSSTMRRHPGVPE